VTLLTGESGTSTARRERAKMLTRIAALAANPSLPLPMMMDRGLSLAAANN
jgi:hypothetical protein